jgi:hypothetical protein
LQNRGVDRVVDRAIDWPAVVSNSLANSVAIPPIGHSRSSIQQAISAFTIIPEQTEVTVPAAGRSAIKTASMVLINFSATDRNLADWITGGQSAFHALPPITYQLVIA